MYFLRAANDLERARIQTIILFDPGSAANMSAPGCDADSGLDINGHLAAWLAASKTHRLIVLTGHDSEEHTFGNFGRSTFAGLWHYYFAGIWNQAFANQAQVCDYNNMGHADVLREFAGVVGAPPSGCPAAPGQPLPVAWNP
jgi:hypothetical protein